MIWKILVLIIIVFFFSYGLEFENRKDHGQKQGSVNNPLYGDWVLIDANSAFDVFKQPRGFSISADTLECYRGFFKKETIAKNNKTRILYCGNYASMQVVGDSIYIDSTFSNTFRFPWKIEKNTFDSLIIVKYNAQVYKFIRPDSSHSQLRPFDKIIYSTYVSFSSSPIFDISMDVEGNVLFRGGRFLEKLGFYSGQLDNRTKEYILSKYDKANILAQNNKYEINATDLGSSVVTFIKNGEIIKSISSYGEAFPRELLWACVPFRNLYITHDLDEISDETGFLLDIYLFAFEQNKMVLPINKSEGFYLQTELTKSKITEAKFIPLYEMSFSEIYFFLEADPFKKDKKTVTRIKTDGQFYTFIFKNDNPITYDLGYNFIERNYNKKSFYEPKGGYRW